MQNELNMGFFFKLGQSCWVMGSNKRDSGSGGLRLKSTGVDYLGGLVLVGLVLSPRECIPRLVLGSAWVIEFELVDSSSLVSLVLKPKGLIMYYVFYGSWVGRICGPNGVGLGGWVESGSFGGVCGIYLWGFVKIVRDGRDGGG